MNKIILRKQAKEQNLTRYFTGKKCFKGHVSERATRNGECLSCAEIRLKDWRVKNPEIQAKHRKKHSILHRERENLATKNWLLNNPEKAKILRLKKNIATKIWSKNNLHKRAANEGKRRAIKLNRSVKNLNDGYLFEIECIYGYCSALRNIGLDYHVDHIVPLQGATVSGFHVPWNLQVITAFDNLSKGNNYA